MKASLVTVLALAACTLASPVGQPHARGNECTCGGSGPGSGSGSEPTQPAPESSASPSGPSEVSTYPGTSSHAPTLPGYQPAPTVTVTTTVPYKPAPESSSSSQAPAPTAPASESPAPESTEPCSTPATSEPAGQPSGSAGPTGPASQPSASSSSAPASEPAGEPSGSSGYPSGPTGPASQPSASSSSTPAGQPSGPTGPAGSSSSSGQPTPQPSSPSSPAGPSGTGSSSNPGGSKPSSTSSTPSSSTPVSTPSSTPSCENGHCHGTGHLIQDLGPQADHLLTVIGNGTEQLLIELSDPVADLLSSLGLTGLAEPVGHIIKDASTIGELITDLGAPVDHLLIAVGKDTGYLLIELDHDVKDLLDSIGLNSLADPVGDLLGAIGSSLKRREDASNPNGLLEKLGPVVDCILRVTGEDTKDLLIKLSDPVAELFKSLGLTGVGRSVGEVIKSAASVGDLIADLGPVAECLLTVIGDDGSALLIKLAPDVADLVGSLGLPGVGEAVGEVLDVVGENI